MTERLVVPVRAEVPEPKITPVKLVAPVPPEVTPRALPKESVPTCKLVRSKVVVALSLLSKAVLKPVPCRVVPTLSVPTSKLVRSSVEVEFKRLLKVEVTAAP